MDSIESRARYICAQRNYLDDCEACNEREGEKHVCVDLWTYFEAEAILLWLRETLQDDKEATSHLDTLVKWFQLYTP